MHNLFRGMWACSGVVLLAALAMMVWYAPVDPSQGLIQKIFYPHLGAASGTLLAALGVLLGSVGYFWQRDPCWDRFADASARVAVLMLSIVLATGMFWARQVWGQWWRWNPPLTFSLILWILYLAYLALRRFQHEDRRRAATSAAFGILASLDVPLVYLSVRFLPSTHLTSDKPAPAMVHTLIVWVIAAALLTASIIWTRTLGFCRPAAPESHTEQQKHITATPSKGRA